MTGVQTCALPIWGDIEKFGTGFYRIQAELKDSPELRLVLESREEVTRSGLDIIPQETPQVTPQYTAQDTAQVTAQDTAQVMEFLKQFEGDMSREELQAKLKLIHRENFRKFYLTPAIAKGLIEMTLPEKPNSKYQKYRLTDKGKRMKDAFRRDAGEFENLRM